MNLGREGMNRDIFIDTMGKTPEEMSNSFHLCPQCLEYDDKTYVSNVHEHCGHCMRSNAIDREKE